MGLNLQSPILKLQKKSDTLIFGFEKEIFAFTYLQ